jgi:hypothetical protein
MVATRYFLTTTSAYGREKKSRAVDRGQLNGDPYYYAIFASAPGDARFQAAHRLKYLRQ